MVWLLPFPRYVNNTSLGARVARLNPQWNQSYTDETLDGGFAKAMALAGEMHCGLRTCRRAFTILQVFCCSSCPALLYLAKQPLLSRSWCFT